MKKLIAKFLLKAGISAAVPAWAGYAAAAFAAAGGALFVAWWLYSSGLEAGRNECAAAALTEQTRQIAANDEARRKSDAEATALINEKEKRDAEVTQLDQQGDSSPGADVQCFDGIGVQRLNRIR